MLPFQVRLTVVYRIFTSFLAAAALASSACVACAAQAYIIVDARTGYVLQAHEAAQKRQVGSLTKVVTAAVILDWAEHKGGSLNQVVEIPQQAFAGVTENPIGWQPGDRASAISAWNNPSYQKAVRRPHRVYAAIWGQDLS